MPSSQILSDFTADGIKGRRCPNFRISMVLASIKQSHLGFNLRKYECARFAERLFDDDRGRERDSN